MKIRYIFENYTDNNGKNIKKLKSISFEIIMPNKKAFENAAIAKIIEFKFLPYHKNNDNYALESYIKYEKIYGFFKKNYSGEGKTFLGSSIKRQTIKLIFNATKKDFFNLLKYNNTLRLQSTEKRKFYFKLKYNKNTSMLFSYENEYHKIR